MSFLRNVATGLRSLFRRKQVDRELDDELATYLEMAVEEKLKQGVKPEEARRTVRVEQGTAEAAKEKIAAAAWESFAETLWQDLRYAVRTVRKTPVFTIVAILTLGLGIGANTAIFQLLDAVRMRNLPVANPQQLAAVRIVGGNHGMGFNQDYGDLTRPIWQEIRDHQHAFSGIFAWSVSQRYIVRGSQMRHFKGLWVSGNFFQELGVRLSAEDC